MDDIKINGRAIYTTKGAAREYGRVGCNFYTGCPHECQYCFLKRGVTGKLLGGNVVQLKKCFKGEVDAIEKFEKEILKYQDILRQTGVFFSFTTDPMIPETRQLTDMAMCLCVNNGIPVKILTKDATWFNSQYIRSLSSDEVRRLVSFGFTLTGRDDMEPKASTNLERIRVMDYLHVNGFKTWASIEPVIGWKAASAVIGLSLDHCDHFKLGLRSGVKKDYYNIGESGAAIMRIVQTVESFGKTIYLKESTRKLLQQFLRPGAYEALLSHTVDLDGNRYDNPELLKE